MISKKIISEIVANTRSFESIFFVFKWSDALLSLEQADISRKIYGLIATLHLISTLRQKQLLSKEDLNVIIDSLTKLYQNALNSILEDAKSHLENEDQIISFCFNLLDQLNQIGSGEYCNIIYSSLLFGFVLSVPNEFSDLFCENLCLSKIEKENMKERNIDSISVLFQKYSFN
jgi:flagellin-specific chaperone FliS